MFSSEHPDFFLRILSPDFLAFLWEKVLRKILQEDPWQILQNLYYKNPRYISAEGPGQEAGCDSLLRLQNLLVVNLV